MGKTTPFLVYNVVVNSSSSSSRCSITFFVFSRKSEKGGKMISTHCKANDGPPHYNDILPKLFFLVLLLAGRIQSVVISGGGGGTSFDNHRGNNKALRSARIGFRHQHLLLLPLNILVGVSWTKEGRNVCLLKYNGWSDCTRRRRSRRGWRWRRGRSSSAI